MNQVAPTEEFEPYAISLPAMGDAASGRRWRLRPFDPASAEAIARRCGVDLILARSLSARGLTAETAESFLLASLRQATPEPFSLIDMEPAIRRLVRALTAGETVGVFGDYDVDGTTATAIFARYFESVGGKLLAYLPDRILEGYGPSIAAFRDLQQKGAALIVTVDCGANAHGVIEAAAGEGLEMIVIDHHQMAGSPPRGALACINPQRLDDRSGLNGFSAAGLAFLVIVGLNRALREAGYFKARAEPDLKALLDLAALGLVCDVMPMTGPGRVLTVHGLRALARGTNRGLAALGRRAGAKGAPSAYHLGFLLGPRLNAAGRIGHARLALELLTTNDDSRAEALAERLHVLNAERQAIEQSVFDDALAQLGALDQSAVIVVAGEGWHPGVIGVVAGRLKEKFDRPAVVIALDGDVGKGSGRSIAGVDLGAAISAAVADRLLIAGGGHKMAAGLTLARDAIPSFTAFLELRLRDGVYRAHMERLLEIDAVIAPRAVVRPLAALIERAGPFGPGNAEPVFALLDVTADQLREVGSGHFSCRLVGRGGDAARAIAFRATESGVAAALSRASRIHVAGKIRADDFRGGEAGQFHIIDVAPAA